MAVEAHHLLHTGGQKLAAIHEGWEGGGGCYDAPGRQECYYGGRDVPSGSQSQLQQGYQHQQSSCLGLAAAPASGPMTMMMMGQYGGGQVCAAESGVTFGGAQETMAPCRKRKRAAEQSPFLGLGVAAHLQQQQQLADVDRLVLQHTANMWVELTERRRRHARQVVAAAEALAAKRLRSKDEEIARTARLNLALEERVRTLFAEAQLWRDLAQSNEAAANALRGELQHALDAQARRGVAEEEAAGDAASCCRGENYASGDGEEEEVGTTTTTAGAGPRRCTVCGEGAAEVLLLPCRHLCACATCAAAAGACPACGSPKNGSVCVNFS